MMKNPLSLCAILLTVGAAFFAPDSSAKNPPETVRLKCELDQPLLVREGGEREVVIKIDLDGIAPTKTVLKRTPLNLAVVLDRSGSMTGRKLEQAKQAAQMLVDQLDGNDVFSLVMYDTDVDVLVHARKVGEGAKKRAELKRIIQGIEAGGSTALYAGVETGGRELAEYLSEERINRVLLLSDGLANVGPKSNREIAKLGQRLAGKGMSVSTIGVGDDYNEDLMTAMAEASDANYYYVADVEELPEIFEQELGELKSVVARRIVLEITFPEGIKPRRFLGRPDAIEGRTARIEFGTLADDQNREILISCGLDPSKLKKQARLAEVSVAWDDSTGAAEDRQEISREVVVDVTDDAERAKKSVNAEVAVQAEIYRNADAADKALALADSGKRAEADAIFGGQIQRLRAAQAGAPAAQQAVLEKEIEVLEESQEGLSEAGLSKTSRKKLQWNLFQRRNAKTYEKAPPKK